MTTEHKPTSVRHEFVRIASRRFPTFTGYQVTCRCGWKSDWNSDPRACIEGHRSRERRKHGL